ncbi:alpha/beta hydrolase fold family protein [Collimonas arenae]|uniref:Alpha/beta hydrolase fold family protein n=1 Tax=Collimonas arenae TaxID=279058 RepID=A0A127PK27_9BURK|nr:alpha/beta hydrolase [Collimonas arenae]AMO98130.1 alpha/beta hydrolase fold family protein [Collimonas arenae]AMP07999.1 alpha/beta hydrolase fold family protein [Collimonas arenae]
MNNTSAKNDRSLQTNSAWRHIAASLFCAVAIGIGALVPAAASDLPEQKSATLFGATIRYYDIGSGPTVVLVHGLGSSAKGDWGRVMLPLAQNHRVLALDQLGFGNSDKPQIDFGIQTWVDFLGEFLRQQQVSDFTLVGESLGGWISAQYTIQALNGIAAGPTLALPKPSRLVLSDSAGLYATMKRQLAASPHGNQNIVGASLAGEKKLLASVFHAPSYHTDQALRDGLAWSLAKGDAWAIRSVRNPALLNETVDKQLSAITIPTLVIWGQHDALLPLSDGRHFASGIADAKLEVIADSGHAPMIETPDAFLAALLPFLR